MTPISPRRSIVKRHERSSRSQTSQLCHLPAVWSQGCLLTSLRPLSSSLKGAARIKDDKDDDDDDSHCLRRTESVKQCLACSKCPVNISCCYCCCSPSSHTRQEEESWVLIAVPPSVSCVTLGTCRVRRMILKILLTHIGPGTMVVPSFLSIICFSVNQAPDVYLFTQPIVMNHHAE